jgi:DNA-binding beta-propeller fold protein YncE
VAVDAAGNVYIADTDNSRVREVSTLGTITTIAGTGSFGLSGDGGRATIATLYSPYGVAVDMAGNLYVADTYNNRIRKVSASS